jgi:hypothetical protein
MDGQTLANKIDEITQALRLIFIALCIITVATQF